MVPCCAPSRDLMGNPRSLPQKDLPTGIAGFKVPEPGFQDSPRLVGKRTKLARRTHPFRRDPAVASHLPRQNWLKMESNKSSTEVLPTTSPKAVNATRSSKATNSRVCWFSSPEQVWSTASRARSSAR